MKVVLRSVLLLTLALLIGATAVAQEQKKKKKQQQSNRGPAATAFDLPETIELTAAQKEKIAALKKEHEPKLAEITKKIDSIITPQVQRARRQAGKAAREAGKKGREVQEAVAAAGDLTDAQRKELAAAQAQLQERAGKIREEVRSLLTNEQRAKLRADRKTKTPKKKKSQDN